jgi:hypothetical protein
MSDKLEALKAIAEEIAPGYMQEWGFERNADTGFADVGVFNESGDWTPFIQVSISDYSGDSMHDAKLAEFLTLATPPVISELLAALEEKKQQLLHYSISPGQADQRLCESRAVRIALGFGEDAIDVAPTDLVGSIQAIRNVAVAAEKSLRASREVVALYDERLKEVEQRAEAAEQRLQQPIKLPELDSDLIDILGRPNFACIRISQRLREMGYEIKRRSENEQAATLHFLLSLYLADSANWRDTAEIALRGNAAKVEGE